VPATLVERGGFAWAKTAAKSAAERDNPWRLLERDLGRDADGRAIIPVVLDANTAAYSLHKGIGDRLEIQAGQAESFVAQIVGLLKNSIFQGEVLVSETAFIEHFPDEPGYRLFLVETPADAQADAVAQVLERGLRQRGFDAVETRERLAGFMAVQNTYLSTFQSLGGLGLLLGTFGLATVQLRNVLERRGELALLRAVGFGRTRLAGLVTLENVFLLLSGLGLGTLAALVAILPHVLAGGATVPWASLAVTLSVVLVVGLLAGLAAVRATLRAPLLPALRGD
jgi:putative ABC transport system permease protein